jgi:amino acid transporter
MERETVLPIATLQPTPAPVAPSITRAGLRPNRLGALGVAFFVVAAVGPMAAIVGGSPVVFAANGASAPATYVLAGVLFAVFSVGYVAMSRHIANAGGFVAYIARGLGPRAATAAAGIAIVCYLALLCALWAFYGVIANQTLGDKLGIHLAGNLWLYLTLIVVTAMTFRGTDVSLRVLGTLLVLEVVVLLVLDVAVLGNGGESGLSLTGFEPSAVTGPGLGIAFLFAVACFTGFEATVVFSEEAREPRRTIPRAAYLAIGFIAVFYALTTWAVSLGYGASTIQDAATNDPAGLIFALAQSEVGGWLSDAMQILVVTSFFAMLLGFTNMFARYVFALGRAGVLPSALGDADPRTGAPQRASLAIGIVIAAIIGAFLAFGADPVTTIYAWLLALGTISLIAILALTSVAILAFFARTRLDQRAWHTRVAPALALAGFLAVGYLAIRNYDALLGGQGGAARWLLLAIPIAAIAGWVYAGTRRALDYSAGLV